MLMPESEEKPIRRILPHSWETPKSKLVGFKTSLKSAGFELEPSSKGLGSYTVSIEGIEIWKNAFGDEVEIMVGIDKDITEFHTRCSKGCFVLVRDMLE
jgi:hypothetical protein